MKQKSTESKPEINTSFFQENSRKIDQKINKHIGGLKNTINYLDLIDIYKIYIKLLQNAHPFQVHMRNLPR